MASLTHVCMWADHNWKTITAEEAARLHPGGTVSAHSGLFMCELCGQYVTFTAGEINARHFRHASKEKSKDCPDRTFGIAAYPSFSASQHELPLRLKVYPSEQNFALELGLLRVPTQLLPASMKVQIICTSQETISYNYSRERISNDTISYLSVSDNICEQYHVKVDGVSDTIAAALREFWPTKVAGILPEGTLFDGETGKKLVQDADVIVGHRYYLMRNGQLHSKAGLSLRQLVKKKDGWSYWYIYEVIAEDYTEHAAKFFLEHHCRLTDTPIDLRVVWPVYVQQPYVVKHNSNEMLFHAKGNLTTVKSFPSAEIRTIGSVDAHNKLISVNCGSRQQLISAGRTSPLQYTYYWKESIFHEAAYPPIHVTNWKGDSVLSGANDALPEKGILQITIPYDGWMERYQNGELQEKRKLKAETLSEIDKIGWDNALVVYMGFDKVWSAHYIQPKQNPVSDNEAIILERLQSYHGKEMTIGHSVGGLAIRLQEYPQIRRWLYRCIRRGTMDERAYRELQHFLAQNYRTVK